MDKFYRGFAAGVLAAVPLNLWSLFSFHILQFTDLRMHDWAGVIMYGSLPRTALQVVSSLAMQLLWSGFRGIIFLYLFPDTKSQGYLGKALIFSLLLGFAESAIGVLYKTPNLAEVTTGTVLSANIGSVLWGVLLAYLVRRFAGSEKRREAG